MKRRTGRLLVLLGLVISSIFLMHPGPGVTAAMPHLTFAPGDVFVSTEENGTVQWWNPDGTPNAVLAGVVPGSAEGMRFDAAGNLYVTHWCRDPLCAMRNSNVEESVTSAPVSTLRTVITPANGARTVW